MAAGRLSGWQAATLIRAFIAVIAFAAVALIFGTKGVIAIAVILFASAVLASERKTQWGCLGAICQILVVILSMLIWVTTLSLAARSGFTAMVASTLLPGIAQAYWIWALLADGKTLSPPDSDVRGLADPVCGLVCRAEKVRHRGSARIKLRHWFCADLRRRPQLRK